MFRYGILQQMSLLSLVPSVRTYLDVINDGFTKAWYDSSILSTLTLTDASVSRWNDYLGSGRDLIQATGSAQPQWSNDGILFDGVNDYLKTAAFTYNKPEMVYIVVKQVTWTSPDRFFDGNISFGGGLVQSTVTPQIYLYAGIPGFPSSANLLLNTYGIVRCLFNEASSKLQVNNNTVITGNPGSNDMGGFILGAQSTSSRSSNIQVKEIILRNVADNATDELLIYNYLRDRHFTNFTYPSVLVDGATVGWYVADASNSTMQLTDASVGRWNDILGSGRDLIQATGSAQPSWSSNGVLFDGVNDYLKTATFTWNQPEQIYMVAKQVSWVNEKYLFDGNDITNGGRVKTRGSSPQMRASSPNETLINDQLLVNTFGIIRLLFDASSSKFIVNNTVPVTGNTVGLANMGAFTLGTRADGLSSSCSNIQVKEIILRNVADNATDEALIYNYLWDKYFDLGLELFSNNSFDSSSNWSLGPGWSIAGGKLNYSLLVTNAVRQDNVLMNSGSTYQFVINIADCSTSARWMLYYVPAGGGGYQQLLSARYSPNGQHIFNLSPATNASGFVLYALDSTNTFSIPELSLKEILNR